METTTGTNIGGIRTPDHGFDSTDNRLEALATYSKCNEFACPREYNVLHLSNGVHCLRLEPHWLHTPAHSFVKGH